MNANLPTAPESYDRRVFERILGKIGDAFSRIYNWSRIEAKVALNFAAPGAVPGVSDQNVTMTGAEFGDTVIVGCSITAPAGFLPPIGFVSATDTVTVRWVQLTGVAANPDGTGADYQIDVWRH